MNMTQDYEKIRDLIPAYALGALDDEEQRLVEAALRDHPELHTELAGYEQVVGALLNAVPQTAPPRALGAKIVALAAESESDLPPTIQMRKNVVPMRGASIRQVLLLAAAAVIVVIAGWFMLRTDEPQDTAEQHIDEILNDDSSHVVAINGLEGYELLAGSFVIAPDHHEAVLQLDNLDVLSN